MEYLNSHSKNTYVLIPENSSNKNLNNLQVTKEIIKVSKKYINLGKRVKIKFVKDRPGHDIRYALNSNKNQLNQVILEIQTKVSNLSMDDLEIVEINWQPQKIIVL